MGKGDTRQRESPQLRSALPGTTWDEAGDQCRAPGEQGRAESRRPHQILTQRLWTKET